jgi:hypothetical protein
VRDVLPDDDTIRLIHIEEGRTIGEKRNFGCSQARGSVVVHFDDDDFSAPGRLADQLERLDRSGKAVTGYRSMKFTDGKRSWQFARRGNYAMGTSFCYRKDWWQAHPFPAVQIGEDWTFLEVAERSDEIISVDAGEMMIASIHPGNTSPRQLQGDNWKALEETL